MSKTREEVESEYKKAMKALEGEKRAATKKAKSLKGKKGKDAMAAVDDEYDAKTKTLQATLEKDLAALSFGDDGHDAGSRQNENLDNSNTENKLKDDGGGRIPNLAGGDGVTDDDDDNNDAAARERKLAKARKKREKQREREAEMERQIAEETANAGPSMRDIELGKLQAVLTPLNLAVGEVQADGHCLYRSVAAQVSLLSSGKIQQDYTGIRKF